MASIGLLAQSKIFLPLNLESRVWNISWYITFFPHSYILNTKLTFKNTIRIGKNNHRLRINFQVSIVFGEWKVKTKKQIRDVLGSRAAWMDAKKPPLSCYADLSSCTSINRRLSSVQRHFAFLIGRRLSPFFSFFPHEIPPQACRREAPLEKDVRYEEEVRSSPADPSRPFSW